jgi:hypothetical protein
MNISFCKFSDIYRVELTLVPSVLYKHKEYGYEQ